MIEKQKMKIEPKFKLAEEFIDLKTLNTNIIMEHLEESIKARELPLERQIKKQILRY